MKTYVLASIIEKISEGGDLILFKKDNKSIYALVEGDRANLKRKELT